MPRTRRVARREAYHRLNIFPSNPQKLHFSSATDYGRDRLQALKNQIRYQYALSDVILRRHLSANDWDVSAVAASFRPEEEEALKNNVSPVGEAHYQSRRASTVRGSRLLAAVDLRIQINRCREEPVKLSHTSRLGLLQGNSWDLKITLAEYEGYKDDLSDIVQQFSHLRPRGPTAMEKDERLAEFITLTSAERFSSSKIGTSLVRLTKWSRLGYLSIVKPK